MLREETNFNPLIIPVVLQGFSPAAKSAFARFAVLNVTDKAQPISVICALDHDTLQIGLSDNSRRIDLKRPLRLGAIIDEITRLWGDYHQNQKDRLIQIGDNTFDPRAMTWQRADTVIALTEKEIAMIRSLLKAHPNPVSRDDILQSVWRYHQDATTHTVETHFWRLRQKIEIDPAMPQIIITTPHGYGLGLPIIIND